MQKAPYQNMALDSTFRLLQSYWTPNTYRKVVTLHISWKFIFDTKSEIPTKIWQRFKSHFSASSCGKTYALHWLTSSEFIAVKKIFAVKIHRSEIGKFTAFMSTRKRGFFRRKTLAKPFISVVFWQFWMFFYYYLDLT